MTIESSVFASLGKPSIPVLSAVEPAPHRPRSLDLLQRVASLAILFIVELIAISVWLDTDSLNGRPGLTGFIHAWGPRILQAIVAFASLLLTFSYLRARSTIRRLSHQLKYAPLAWGLFAWHATAMAGFGILSFILFAKSPGPSADWIAGAWLLAGTAGIVSAGVAFLPLRFLHELFRHTGPLWLAAALTGMVASLLSRFGQLLWDSAAALTFSMVNAWLRLLLSSVISDPLTRTIGTQRFAVTIEPACSGLEGVGLILVFAIAWLWFFRHECRFPHALIVIPAGVGMMCLLNGLRITALILIGNAGAPGIAVGGFHSQAGWIVFNGVALACSLAFQRVPWLMAGKPAIRAGSAESPAAAYLAPLLAILAAAMISSSLSSGFEWLYPLRFFAAGAALWSFRHKYASLDWSVGWFAPMIGGVVFVFWLVADWAGGNHTDTAIATGIASLPVLGKVSWLIFRVLAAVATVPIAEELAFRGFLIRRLMAADFEILNPRVSSCLAVAVSSLAFGALHGDRWIAGAVAGLLYAWALLRRGSIGDAVAAHATTNALLAACVLFGGKWYLW